MLRSVSRQNGTLALAVLLTMAAMASVMYLSTHQATSSAVKRYIAGDHKTEHDTKRKGDAEADRARHRLSHTCGEYVCFAAPTTGNGLGNHLFYVAGVTYVAALTQRTPCQLAGRHNRSTPLDSVFHLPALVRYDADAAGCSLHEFRTTKVYAYDRRVKRLSTDAGDETIWTRGAFASWKYVEPVARTLRRWLQFRPEVLDAVRSFLDANVPRDWTAEKMTRVGVHVRRGDYLGPWAMERGFTVADERYLQRAMQLVLQLFARRVQFIVACVDMKWCLERFPVSADTFNRTSADFNVTFSVGHTAGEDLALLSTCNHTIMTTGTYSWWAAWLTGGLTVYYGNFPRPGSWLYNQAVKEDWFHPTWIRLD